MIKLVRFGVSLKNNLIKKFDEEIQKQGYDNRSKAIGDLIRNWLIQQKLNLKDEKGIGIITLLYDHEIKTTTDALLNLQHSYSNKVVTTTHIHLNSHICLEVIIVRGKVIQIKKIADQLSPIRGVKQVQLTLTTTQGMD